ncbi:MAG TPA: NAD(P)/FAD-dependent oxidoreductase, partial [Kiritimatiellia bacterium]|nr:NAD(P)/FAD-dependent oxidoreductase [Kiritimatiellia bacterium]
TSGGVALRQVKPDTLEGRLASRLFFAGEILDLDGPTGGWNLQWAFASGHLAGQSAVGGSGEPRR